MGLTAFLYFLLGAVFCKQLCLFLVLLSSPLNFLLGFGAFKLGLGEKGHHQKLYVPVPPSGRPGLPKSSPPPLLAEGSFSSCGKCSSSLSLLGGSGESQGSADLSKEERDDDEDLYVLWVCKDPGASLPFGTLSTPGCLTERCNSWHCITCS